LFFVSQRPEAARRRQPPIQSLTFKHSIGDAGSLRKGRAFNRRGRAPQRGSNPSARRRRGDRANAAHARYRKSRDLLLIGRLDDVERLLADFDPAPLPPASRAGCELVAAGLAMRRRQRLSARGEAAEVAAEPVAAGATGWFAGRGLSAA